MLINYSLLIALAVIAAILVILIFIRLFKKSKGGGGVGFVIGLFVGGGLAAFIIMFNNSKVYIVHGNDDYSTFAAYGTSEYKMADGTIINVDAAGQSLLIINDSKINLVLEEIVYGSFGYASTVDISAGTTHQTDKISSVNYFFDDTPPETVQSNDKRVEHYWLRARRE